jgi:hypothetical protein
VVEVLVVDKETADSGCRHKSVAIQSEIGHTTPMSPNTNWTP